jgi:hypothetical protein
MSLMNAPCVITIVPGYVKHDHSDESLAGEGTTTPTNPTGALTPGVGSGSKITLDPDLADADVCVYGADGKLMGTPVPEYLALGHELIHAGRNETGQHSPPKETISFSNGPVPGTVLETDTIDKRDEEVQTIEGAGYNGINENSLRAEHGEPPRSTGTSGTGDYCK